jgi:hypothetical protein
MKTGEKRGSKATKFLKIFTQDSPLFSLLPRSQKKKGHSTVSHF